MKILLKFINLLQVLSKFTSFTGKIVMRGHFYTFFKVAANLPGKLRKFEPQTNVLCGL